MVQQIVITSEEENKKVIAFSRKWEIPKYETIKKIIREFEEVEQ